MEYVKKLLESETYLSRLFELENREKDRRYCVHDLDHFLHVARIAYILSMERGLGLDKEEIYLCGLLHDLGRVEEYRSGISHAEASAAAAREILRVLGYDPEKSEEICYALSRHSGRVNLRGRTRTAEESPESTGGKSVDEKSADISGAGQKDRREVLAETLSLADQLSRNCFACRTADSCKWKDQERTTGGDLI